MFNKAHAVGSRPGTLVYSANALPSRVKITHYNQAHVEVSESTRPQDLTREALLDRPDLPNARIWIDVHGLGSHAVLEQLAATFSIHPLALEDVVNVPQTPKADQYEDQLLLIVRTVDLNEDNRPQTGQVAVIMGPDFVLTFQDTYSELLEPIHDRISRPTARLRRLGPDYLAYAVLDTAIDAYYPVLGRIGETLESLENLVIESPNPKLLRQLHRIKNALINLRRAVWPQRTAVNSLVRDDHPLISKEVAPFLRDTYDHCVQTSEVIDMYREMATSLFNTYLSSVGHRTNEIMKVLTIMSSMFVPLTFVAGIYGMNFEYMPELQVRWAYPIVWMLMGSIIIGMLLFFARRGWLSPQSIPDIDRAPPAAAADVEQSIVRTLDPVQMAALRESSTLRKAG